MKTRIFQLTSIWMFVSVLNCWSPPSTLASGADSTSPGTSTQARAATQPAATRATPLPARLARWSVVVSGILLLLVPLGMASIFANILPGYVVPSIWFEIPTTLTVLLFLSYELGVLALAISIFAVVAWTKHYWSRGGRVFYSLLALLALLITWSLAYWDLL